MDLKRISSAMIVAIALVVILIIPSKLITSIIFAAIAVVAIHEYMKVIKPKANPIKWLGYASCIIVIIANYIPEQYKQITYMLFIPLIITLSFAQAVITNMKTTVKDIAYTILGISYIPVFVMFLSLVNAMENGKILLIYIFIASWGTDVFAYLIGSRIGKHKFSKVSPKKSIEGCIGGTIGATILMLIFTLILSKNYQIEYSYITIITVGIILSIIGQLGDFAASTIKRYVDIKDFSNLLPGHGGMLDRIDSLMFIAPFAYLLFSII